MQILPSSCVNKDDKLYMTFSVQLGYYVSSNFYYATNFVSKVESTVFKLMYEVFLNLNRFGVTTDI